MKSSQYVILGLGIFGSTIVKTLSSFNCEVIAIDRDLGCVERVSDYATQAVQADITDFEQLKALGVGDCDAAIVATGSHLEESCLAIINLKQLGVPFVLAKAKNNAYKQVLLKVGADRVVQPEKEIGVQAAKSLLSDNIIDLIQIDSDYNIIEIQAPKKWAAKSLIELNLRNNYGINVIAIRKGPKEKLIISPPATYIIQETDQLLVVADMVSFEKFDYLNKI